MYDIDNLWMTQLIQRNVIFGGECFLFILRKIAINGRHEAIDLDGK